MHCEKCVTTGVSPQSPHESEKKSLPEHLLSCVLRSLRAAPAAVQPIYLAKWDVRWVTFELNGLTCSNTRGDARGNGQHVLRGVRSGCFQEQRDHRCARTGRGPRQRAPGRPRRWLRRRLGCRFRRARRCRGHGGAHVPRATARPTVAAVLRAAATVCSAASRSMPTKCARRPRPGASTSRTDRTPAFSSSAARSRCSVTPFSRVPESGPARPSTSSRCSGVQAVRTASTAMRWSRATRSAASRSRRARRMQARPHPARPGQRADVPADEGDDRQEQPEHDGRVGAVHPLSGGPAVVLHRVQLAVARALGAHPSGVPTEIRAVPARRLQDGVPPGVALIGAFPVTAPEGVGPGDRARTVGLLVEHGQLDLPQLGKVRRGRGEVPRPCDQRQPEGQHPPEQRHVSHPVSPVSPPQDGSTSGEPSIGRARPAEPGRERAVGGAVAFLLPATTGGGGACSARRHLRGIAGFRPHAACSASVGERRDARTAG
ncbi:hypothetical protein SMICM17S_10065 [Streptomyces microflavus]